MKVFVDTNVLAAGFATRGLCSDLMREVLANHELVSSRAIFSELKRILIKKFDVPEYQTKKVLDFMGSVSLPSEPVEQAAYPISDTDDIPHLSAAESAQCAVFVTGDKDLWAIQTQSGMRVLSPRNFWETISAQQKSGANANKPRSTD